MDLLECAHGMNTSFKRKIFFHCSDWIVNNPMKVVLVLTGPRRCGKSVCIKQLGQEYRVSPYDFKQISDIDKQNEILYQICSATEGLFLLDEVTSIVNYPEFIRAIANSITDNIAAGVRDDRRIIITGSQEYALKYVCGKMLSMDADYVHTSFIDFEEWLVWRNKVVSYDQPYHPTAEDFMDYMFNSIEFTKTTNNLQYIKDCLQETIESELKSNSVPIGLADSGIVSAEDINRVLNTFLISMHNRISRSKMYTIKDNLMGIKTGNYKLNGIKASDLSKSIQTRLGNFDTVIKGMSFKRFCACLVFLQQCDLITLTEVTNKVPSRRIEDLFNGVDVGINDIGEFLSVVNICVKHPMFYFNLIREILQGEVDLMHRVPMNVYGSAYECAIRGLFSYRERTDFLLEFVYNENGCQGEIDLIIPDKAECYEFTVGNSHNINHFARVKGGYSKYIYEDSKTYQHNGLMHANYLEALLYHSRGLFTKEKPADIRWI